MSSVTIKRNDPYGKGYPVPSNLKGDGENGEDGETGYGVFEDLFSEDPTYIATIGPDPDSHRLNPLNFKTVGRGRKYPYDSEGTYGEPNAGNATQKAHSVQQSFELVPIDTSHSAWDDLEEMIGYPMLLSRGGSSDIGSSIPGLGGFSTNPPKPWDDEEEQREDDIYEDNDFNPEIPPTERCADPGGPRFKDQNDDDVEKKIQRIFGIGDNPNSRIVMKPKADRTIQKPNSMMDLFHSNSAWGDLIKFIIQRDIIKNKDNNLKKLVFMNTDGDSHQ